ncbi:conserved hypothetical protein, putative N-terminal methylation [Sulfurovum sp. enrichment culture clone C5]|uniref:Type II secretion system protein n=1 Tax=Sulfurovum sp. enrichment culture clone C5 TaxID=497650 RepID=A0A0S4XQD5_9BACT|nr:conserved hypothetical protein, putative N-terminal methylation [Sulfurovum sp. enrichment culture clone C5]
MYLYNRVFCRVFLFRKAFTMIEAIMVIVVMGIIAAVAIPRLENDSLQEASDQILSDIRYTQHLALTDDVTNPNDNEWQRHFWRIQFQNMAASNTGWTYSVGSSRDVGGTNIDLAEAAIDPLDGRPIFGLRTFGNTQVSPKVFIGRKYGINNVNFIQCGNGLQHIGFDRLGRLHQGFTASITPDYSTILRTPCTITFTRNDGASFTIQINPETGYAFRTDQPNM